MAEPKETPQVTVGDILFQKAYIPTLIKACADSGLPINSQDELIQAVRIIDRLNAAGAGQTKQAEASGMLKLAAEALDARLGVGPDETAQLAQDPDIQAALQVATSQG